MSLDKLEDDLILSFDEDYVDEPGAVKHPITASEPEAVREDDPISTNPRGAGEASEKAIRTKAYKFVAPVGALFGRLAKVGLGAASCFACSLREVLCGALHPSRPVL